MNTDQLVKNAINGDRDAFCALYSEYSQKLYRYALYKLQNPQDAEDAVSDTIVAAYQQIGNLRKPGSFSAWIFRIMNATCTKYIDNQAKLRQTQDIDQWQTNYQLVTEFNPKTEELIEALNSLSQQEQNVVLLSIVAGLSSKEIARLLDMTPGSVRSKLSRSLEKMKKFWGDAQ